DSGTTHFLISVSTIITGQGKSGQLHIKDVSPGNKGEIKILPKGASFFTLGFPNGDTTQVFQTPGADYTIQGASNDKLPWDHAINATNIDFDITMDGLLPGATWGISQIIAGAHRMPCHCQPGAPQNVAAD